MKTVILDFDGTLADSFGLCLEIAHELTGKHILTDRDRIEELKSSSLIDVARELEIPKYEWPRLVIRGRKIMFGRLNELKAFSGMDKVLAELKNDGFKLYIMSNNSQDNIAKFLKQHSLSSYITNTYGDIGLLGKTRELKKILKQNKLRASDVVYIGDEVRDIEAAKKADVRVISVSWGFNSAKRLAEDNPDALVYRRSDLVKAIKSLEKVSSQH